MWREEERTPREGVQERCSGRGVAVRRCVSEARYDVVQMLPNLFHLGKLFLTREFQVWKYSTRESLFCRPVFACNLYSDGDGCDADFHRLWK